VKVKPARITVRNNGSKEVLRIKKFTGICYNCGKKFSGRSLEGWEAIDFANFLLDGKLQMLSLKQVKASYPNIPDMWLTAR